jgi:hypothetical protein
MITDMNEYLLEGDVNEFLDEGEDVNDNIEIAEWQMGN